MRIFTIVVVILMGLSSCEKERQMRNPNLGEMRFTYTIDLNQPLFNSLKTPSNSVFVPYGGIRGFFVINNSGSSYYAWEAACPNHTLSNCGSRLFGVRAIDDENSYESVGHSYTYAKCPCCKTVYNLRTGTSIVIGENPKPYPLLNYNVSNSGSYLTISN